MITFKFKGQKHWHGSSFMKDKMFLNRVCNYLLNDTDLLNNYPSVAIYLYQIPQINTDFYLNGVMLILNKNDDTEIHVTCRERLGYIRVWVGHCGNIVYNKELVVKEITEYGTP